MLVDFGSSSNKTAIISKRKFKHKIERSYFTSLGK